MKKIAASLAVVAALFATSAHATSYTNCLAISKPTPGDPTVANVWGSILNTNFDLIDTGIAQTLPLSVTGGTVTLTTSNGATDQSRYKIYALSGTLTGNELILFPPSPRCGSFSVQNSTTGAFTVTIGVSNGSGGVLGTSVAVPQGGTVPLNTDGTNAFSAGAGAGVNANITAITGLSTPLSVGQGGTGATSLGNFALLNAANVFTGNQTIQGAGLSLTVQDDAGHVVVRNTVGANILYTSTVKNWIGSGSDVTDAAIGANGTLNFYTAGSSTAAAVMDASGNLAIAGALNPTNASGTRTNLGLGSFALLNVTYSNSTPSGSATNGAQWVQW